MLNIKYLKKVFLERPRKEKKLPKVIDRNHLINSINKIDNKLRFETVGTLPTIERYFKSLIDNLK